MLVCPRCHQSVKADAIECPRCRTPLKAHGHPGIVLHRASGTESLCETCLYDADDTCNYPQRPDARECTMYQNKQVATIAQTPTRDSISPGVWMRRNSVWFVLIGIILVCFGLALAKR